MKTKNYLWIIALFLLSFTFIQGVSAKNENYIELGKLPQPVSDSITQDAGACFQLNSNVNVTLVYVNQTSSGTRARITTGSATNTTYFATANNASGKYFYFNYNITNTVIYCVKIDSSGSAYTRYYNVSNVYPYTETILKWTGGVYNDGADVNAFNNIYSMYFENMTKDPANVSLSLKSSFDNSQIYNFSATINGTTYTTTNGNIITNIPSSSGTNINITFFNITDNGGYYNVSYINQNVTTGITGYTYQANITFIAYKKITNASINGNISNGTYNYGLTNVSLPWNAGTFNITFSNSTTYNKTQQFTINPLTSGNVVNITGVYNSVLNVSIYNRTGGFISNSTGWISTGTYNESFNATTGSTLLQLISGLNYTIYVQSYGYAITTATNNKTLQLSGTSNTTSFTLYEANSIQITFKHLLNNSLTSSVAVSLDVIGSIYSNNYSTSNGTLYIMLPDPGDYDLRYSATGYAQNFYFLSLDANDYNALTLYLLSNSLVSNVTVSIIDETGQALEGAVLKVLRYDIASNTFILAETSSTNFLGQSLVHLTLGSEYYKFMVEYDGELVKTTSPSYILSTTLTIPVNIGGTIAEEYYNYKNLEHELSFNNGTNNFRLNYDDTSGITGEVCLKVYTVGVLISLYNSSCSTSASGTILLSVANTTGVTYMAVAEYLDSNNVYQYISTMYRSFDSNTNSGNLGLLLQVVFSVTLTILSIPTGFAPTVFGLTLVIGSKVGLHMIPMPICIILVVVGLIVTVLLAKPRG